MSDEESNSISKKATIIGLALLLVAVTGTFILDIFKITMDGLRIAGSILLFIVAVDILMGDRRKRRYVETTGGKTDTDALATFPIALPLYTGPGAITAAIVLYSTAGTILLKALVLVAIILTYVIVRITHMYRNQIVKALGKSGVTSLPD